MFLVFNETNMVPLRPRTPTRNSVYNSLVSNCYYLCAEVEDVPRSDDRKSCIRMEGAGVNCCNFNGYVAGAQGPPGIPSIVGVHWSSEEIRMLDLGLCTAETRRRNVIGSHL